MITLNKGIYFLDSIQKQNITMTKHLNKWRNTVGNRRKKEDFKILILFIIGYKEIKTDEIILTITKLLHPPPVQ